MIRAIIPRFLLLSAITLWLNGHAQHLPSRHWADSVLNSLEKGQMADPANMLGVIDTVLRVFAIEHDTCKMAHASSKQSVCFDGLGQLDSAMTSIQRGLAWFRPGCDSLTLMSLNANLSGLYLSLNEYDLVDSICTISLRTWNNAWAYSSARNAMLTNRAIAHAYRGDMEMALDAFRLTFRTAEQEANVQNQFDALNNLGALFAMVARSDGTAGALDSSEHYFSQALVLSRKLVNDRSAATIFSNLATIAGDRQEFRIALQLLDSATMLAERASDLRLVTTLEFDRSAYLYSLGEIDSAYAHLKVYITLQDSLLNEEKVRAIADVREKYETEKKARENQELRAENLSAELRNERVTRMRNIYLFSALGVVLVAAGLYSRLRYTRKSRAAIQKEKEISEGLLHNILPEEVADELRAKGYADAKQFDRATILFSDFKGFTQLSEKLSPSELVKEIDTCFKAFDEIMEKYQIEKIKTIGDAYMAAGGLPDASKGSPFDVVCAALDMQDFMNAYKDERSARQDLFFEMRVGIHTGPVIAGIVGVKKFAYDIWGDTVNTASRMESSGEVGRVNISNDTYLEVKDAPGLKFAHRGHVKAKGKGAMEMWFVARA